MMTKLILLALLCQGGNSVRMPGRTVKSTVEPDEEGERARRLLDIRRRLAPTGGDVDLEVSLTNEEKLAIKNQDKSVNADPLIVGISRQMAALIGKANGEDHSSIRGGNARCVCLTLLLTYFAN